MVEYMVLKVVGISLGARVHTEAHAQSRPHSEYNPHSAQFYCLRGAN